MLQSAIAVFKIATVIFGATAALSVIWPPSLGLLALMDPVRLGFVLYGQSLILALPLLIIWRGMRDRRKTGL